MAEGPWRTGGAAVLLGRHDERAVLLRLVDAIAAGGSQVLVVRGDPGIGKTALLDFLAERAEGCQVVRVTGVQTEMELPFAGLHQLCAPMFDRLDGLPAPQTNALRVAFGMDAGPVPDRFLIGLAVLGLLSEAAERRPLLCVIDDQQWIDRASAQALGFVARRLAAEPIGLVFGTRTTGEELAGLPEMVVPGLPREDARALLGSALPGPMDERVRDQILMETGGNPLALLELLRGLPRPRLAGGYGLTDAVSLSARIEASFTRRLQALPEDTRRLLLLAAADPSGDTALVWRAARHIHIPLSAARPAVAAGLAEFGARVWFRHPLLRSAAYRSAALADRWAAHLALAEATDADADPDRRAWHRAQAADGPDEYIAAELERSADRAQARGGPAAAAAFLERAVVLTAEPARRTERILAAARAGLRAGAYDQVLQLLAEAEKGLSDDLQGARADLLRGQVAFFSGMGDDAPPLLLKAARRLEALDLDLARETYLTAWVAAVFAGRLAGVGNLLEVCRTARELPWSSRPGRAELVLDALTLLVTDGTVAAKDRLRAAVDAFSAADVDPADHMRLGSYAQSAAISLWDMDAWRALVERQAAVVRAAGALDLLPVVLVGLGATTTWAGDLAASAGLITEADTVAEATGTRAPPFAALMLPAIRGDEAAALPLIEATITAATAGGQGLTVGYANWVTAILYNGLSRYTEALEAARKAGEDALGALYVSLWALPELIEAAVRSGDPSLATEAMTTLAHSTRAGGTDFGLGIEARSRALLSDGESADQLYREAIERLSRTNYRPDLGRAHLLYGEWLRRQGRRTAARTHLQEAHDLLAAIGVGAFAERARRELQANGERVQAAAAVAGSALTGQEMLIARLARQGRSNPEIGTQLFISARTVEWHLRNIYAKLQISSRRELRHVLDNVLA
ncbi:BREX system ATP-binding domain-containing protein [Streptomyces sp. NPDC046821]|uniref:helix-turn-helix transcriptional regulator n=1 Tax=Streptomyces sp. NPDC046821 TaxID=3154702 RepID=UPI0033EBEC27